MVVFHDRLPLSKLPSHKMTAKEQVSWVGEMQFLSRNSVYISKELESVSIISRSG